MGKKPITDENGFIKLVPKVGGDFDTYVRAKKGRKKMPKNPDKYLEEAIVSVGIDSVISSTDVNIGDYVYDKGIIHALNMNVGRNIPWIEDGLKSVERRVLYVMYKSGFYGSKSEKVAGVTGNMISMVYPHGDAAAADTIYRLGRRLSTMIPYVEAGGNYGNMYDLKPAAPRYAEASLSNYTMDCFFSEMGMREPIYDEKDNYKYDAKEPIFLTSRYPNVLMQWNLGIGKGAMSWLAAFNPEDVFKTTIAMLDDPKVKVDIYPDCPIPVDIVNKAELKGCFDKAEFKVKLRAKYEFEVDKRRDSNGHIQDKYTIVFTSVPIGTYGMSIQNEIIAIKDKDQKRSDKKLPEVVNVECEASNKTPGGIRFIVEYEKGYDPNVLVEKLFKSTSLERTIGVKYNLITENRPCMYTPRQIVMAWIDQRFDQKRRFYHQKALEAAKNRAKFDAICTVLNAKNIDQAIALIRKAKNDDESVKSLQDAFGFTEFQARIVIAIKLGTLSKMNIHDTEEKRDDAHKQYQHYRKLLTDEHAIKDAIREELVDGLNKYGVKRRATLRNISSNIEDPTASKILVYNSETYFCLPSYDALSTIANKIDKSYDIMQISNGDTIMILGRKGVLKVLDGYAFAYNDQGIGLSNIAFSNVVKILPISNADYPDVALITEQGYGKVMALDECTKSVKGKVINLNATDSLAAVIPVNGGSEDILGMVDKDLMYYVKVSSIPVLKRSSAGNRLIRGVDDLNITNAVCYDVDTKYIMIYGESGYIKVLDTVYLNFSKKGNNCISLQGKGIYGSVPISDNSQKFTMYDVNGALGITLDIDKTIKFTADSGETQKFKMSTSIGSAIKVLKKSKYEFYKIM